MHIGFRTSGGRGEYEVVGNHTGYSALSLEGWTFQLRWPDGIVFGLSGEGMTDDYEIVCDGDPRMDGSHERWTLGRFNSLDAARDAMRLVILRSERAPKENLRIERRRVTQWEVVDESSQ